MRRRRPGGGLRGLPSGDPPPPGSRVVRAEDGVALHVEVDDGPRQDADARPAVTVVLVHGFTARLGEWEGQRAALAGRARVVAHDHRGHGRSGWGSRRRATVDQLARDLDAVLAAVVPAGPVLLAGHSLGGMVLMAWARLHPERVHERVAGVFLLATTAGDVVSDGPLGRVAGALKRAGLLRAALPLLRAWFALVAPVVERVRRPGTRAGRAYTRRYLFGSADADADDVRRVQDMLEETPFTVSAAFYASLAAHDERSSLRLLAGRPVAVVVGTDDRLTPLRANRSIAALVGPDAELVEVPGAGHSVNLTRPDVVDAALLRTLDRARDHAAAQEQRTRRRRLH